MSQCPECGGELKLFWKEGIKIHKENKMKYMKTWYRCELCKRFEKVYLRMKE